MWFKIDTAKETWAMFPRLSKAFMVMVYVPSFTLLRFQAYEYGAEESVALSLPSIQNSTFCMPLGAVADAEMVR